MKRNKLSDTLTWLQEKDGLDDSWLNHAKEILQKQEPDSPWYVRLMIAFSAWITMILIIAFLILAGIVRSSEAALVIGLITLPIAVGIHRNPDANEFKSQISLALSLTGQGLVWFGLLQPTNITISSIAAIFISAGLIHLYADPLHRFLSTLIIITAMTVIISDLRQHELYNALTIFCAFAIVGLLVYKDRFMNARWASIYTPVLYGLIVGLLLLLLPSSLHYGRYNKLHLVPGISTTGIGLALLYLQYQLLSTYKLAGANLLTFLFALTTALLIIATQAAPGILTALLIITIGFSRSQKSIEGLGMVFLVWYLSAWYYNMSSSLLEKSISLSVAGLVLLAMAFWLNHYKPGEQSR